jgi:hypothetical protein
MSVRFCNFFQSYPWNTIYGVVGIVSHAVTNWRLVDIARGFSCTDGSTCGGLVCATSKLTLNSLPSN